MSKQSFEVDSPRVKHSVTYELYRFYTTLYRKINIFNYTTYRNENVYLCSKVDLWIRIFIKHCGRDIYLLSMSINLKCFCLFDLIWCFVLDGISANFFLETVFFLFQNT